MVETKHLRKRIRYRTKLLKDLRLRFRKGIFEFINSKSNKKDIPESKIDEVVLIREDGKKRLNWPLAMVIDVLPGRDIKIRTVKAKTQSGVSLRPVQRIFPL
ncbi:DUF5641 domain-containing protein [Trichonephila clavipes]|nr:DUF5641 domain-containing protein [Trichonephila clavipes]